jgi:hypothetical protein
VNTLQTWIFVGIPALVLAAGLFAGRSTVRAAFGYVVLVVTLLVFLLVPRSPTSAGVVGMVAFLLVAAGRGFAEDEKREDYGQRVPDRVGDEEVEEPRRV